MSRHTETKRHMPENGEDNSHPETCVFEPNTAPARPCFLTFNWAVSKTIPPHHNAEHVAPIG